VALSNLDVEEEATWLNVTFDVGVDLKGYPAGQVEIWKGISPNGYVYGWVGNLPGAAGSYSEPQAVNIGEGVRYKARYKNGAVVGPFSNELRWPAAPPAPVVLGAEVLWHETQFEWSDVVVSFSFDYEASAQGMIRVWRRMGGDAEVFDMWDEVSPSNTSYRDNLVTDGNGGRASYKLQWVGGQEGPFSSEVVVNIDPV
jgi:hypothetical protein